MRFVGLLLALAVAGFLCGAGALPIWAFLLIELGVFVGYVLLWSMLFPDPLQRLAALPVAKDDPLMSEAVEKARESLAHFLEELYPKHRDLAMVKFRFTTSRGTEEGVWASIQSVDGDQVEVKMVSRPVEHDGPVEPVRRLTRDDLVDWQVELPDGSIRGGRTNLALFLIYERETGSLHPGFEKHLERFVDR